LTGSKAENMIAPECPRNDRKTLGDGFGRPFLSYSGTSNPFSTSS